MNDIFRFFRPEHGAHSKTNYCNILFNQFRSSTRRRTDYPPWLTKGDAGRALPVMPG